MKERIYTIPITEAFSQDCECPLCLCEKKLENDALEYTLGPSMMEPDSRVETNHIGFCTRHFGKLYNLQQNRLALGLLIDTHMVEQGDILEALYSKHAGAIQKECEKGFLEDAINNLSGKKTASSHYIKVLTQQLEMLHNSCAVCNRVQNNMDKFIDVTLYLFFKETEFRQKFESSKGFCLKHMLQMVKFMEKEYSTGKQAQFIKTLLPMQIKHMKRVQEDVKYFTEMYDYKNQGADWRNSRDAIPRSIEKICGPSDLQR